VTDTQDQLDVLSAPADSAGATPDSKDRAKRRSGSLSSMLLPELQALAGSLGLATGKMRKSDLVAAIENAQRGASSTASAKAGASTTTTRPRRSASRPQAAAQPTLTDSAPADSAPADSAPAADSAPTSDTAAFEAPAAPPDGSAQPSRQQGDRPERSQGNRNSGGQQAERPERSNNQANRNSGGQQGGGGQNNQGNRNAGGQNQGGQNGQGGQNRNNNNDDDDDFGGGNRRGRRYRDRRGRTRDRFDGQGSGGGGRQDAEPVISDDDVLIPVAGILDSVEDKNTWFIRVSGYFASADDVYVANSHVRRYGLRRGDAVTGVVRQPRDGERKEKYNPLVRMDSVNGVDPEQAKNRVEFTKLTPLYPQDRLRLETEPHILTTRVIDLVMPIGKGQRALIVSPPKAGKTSVLQAIANAITVNNPECHLMVVLVDERPEEVTDMQRSVKGEVIASTFDRRPQDHTMVAELSIERAKRLVEMGHDVVVLLDSITRLGRAYNLAAPASGRILSGGVDSTALYPPKRFLGAARNIEHGGSLTILATALVETGSTMDTVIFEEFKGTGNAELILDRKIADKRVFPAVDVDKSGTRKEEILLSPDELAVVLKLRRVLHALDPQQGIDLLLDRLKKTRTNIEFLMQIAKTTPGADDR
jgi:transcription termination factor Rho